MLIVFLLIIWGPACRAIIDKLWITHQSIEIIGQWAQLQAVADFIAAPAFLGVGYGLTVLIAQTKEEDHFSLLLTSCILGLVTCAPMLIGSIIFSNSLGALLGLDSHFVSPLIIISLVGWLGIASGQLCSFWLGTEQRGKILLFTLATGVPGILILVAVLSLQTTNPILTALTAGLGMSIAINAWIVFTLFKYYQKATLSRSKIKKSFVGLIKYLPAGFSIGILTPISTLAVRSIIAHHLNWEAAGTATALWRASDWILNCSQGVLYFCFLPKLSSQAINGNPVKLIHKIALRILLPALLAFLFLEIYREPILIWLYSEHITFNWKISALFWTGDFIRILAGIFLMGLYALKASRAISFGELLSQPLFALFLFLGIGGNLEFVGIYHLLTYLIYASFCIGMFYLINKRDRSST